jgi:hypothetical protein
MSNIGAEVATAAAAAAAAYQRQKRCCECVHQHSLALCTGMPVQQVLHLLYSSCLQRLLRCYCQSYRKQELPPPGFAVTHTIAAPCHHCVAASVTTFNCIAASAPFNFHLAGVPQTTVCQGVRGLALCVCLCVMAPHPEPQFKSTHACIDAPACPLAWRFCGR